MTGRASLFSGDTLLIEGCGRTDYAVPDNRQCGVCPPDLPDSLARYCRQMSESPQG